MDRNELLAWIDSLCFLKWDREFEWEGQEFAAEWLRVLLEEIKSAGSPGSPEIETVLRT